MTALIVTLIVLGSIAAWFALAVISTRVWWGKDPSDLGGRWNTDTDDVYISFFVNCFIWPLLLPVGLVRRAVIRSEGEFIRLLDPRYAAKEKQEKRAAELHSRALSMAELARTLTDETEYKLIADESYRLVKEAQKLDPRAYYTAPSVARRKTA
jgi:hypothetical protein